MRGWIVPVTVTLLLAACQASQPAGKVGGEDAAMEMHAPVPSRQSPPATAGGVGAMGTDATPTGVPAHQSVVAEPAPEQIARTPMATMGTVELEPCTVLQGAEHDACVHRNRDKMAAAEAVANPSP